MRLIVEVLLIVLFGLSLMAAIGFAICAGLMTNQGNRQSSRASIVAAISFGGMTAIVAMAAKSFVAAQ